MLLYLDIDEEEIKSFHRKIAKKVKEKRKEKNFSQTNLALSIGYKSVSIISKIEAGLEDKHYNIEQLYKISKALDIEIKEFF